MRRFGFMRGSWGGISKLYLYRKVSRRIFLSWNTTKSRHWWIRLAPRISAEDHKWCIRSRARSLPVEDGLKMQIQNGGFWIQQFRRRVLSSLKLSQSAVAHVDRVEGAPAGKSTASERDSVCSLGVAGGGRRPTPTISQCPKNDEFGLKIWQIWAKNWQIWTKYKSNIFGHWIC